MSNTTATNPIICNATGALISGAGKIKAVVFTNTGSDGDHTLLLTDSTVASGTKKVVQLELTAEIHTIVQDVEISFIDGLYCETVDGGEALVYLE